MELDVGFLLALSPGADSDRIGRFAQRTLPPVVEELRAASGVAWRVHDEEPVRLADAEARRPSDFLDEASLRMVEGPYDMVLVLTDVPIVSRRHQAVPGTASRVGRVMVVSLRPLLTTRRGLPSRPLEDETVAANAATLILHLVATVLGVGDAGAGDATAPFRFDESRRVPTGYAPAARERIAARARHAPERTIHAHGSWRRLAFHLASAARSPARVLAPVLRSRAPFLALGLPGLATAAVVPTLILIFTAEIWDVGLGMTDRVALGFAVASVLAATWYLTTVQHLFFPQREQHVLTESVAGMNVAIFLTILLGVIGLFVMIALLMLMIEFLVFPPGLMATWPTLEDPEVTTLDKVRLAGFISSVGVLTGALAGGLESRTVIRHLALFRP